MNIFYSFLSQKISIRRSNSFHCQFVYSRRPRPSSPDCHWTRIQLRNLSTVSHTSSTTRSIEAPRSASIFDTSSETLVTSVWRTKHEEQRNIYSSFDSVWLPGKSTIWRITILRRCWFAHSVNSRQTIHSCIKSLRFSRSRSRLGDNERVTEALFEFN